MLALVRVGVGGAAFVAMGRGSVLAARAYTLLLGLGGTLGLALALTARSSTAQLVAAVPSLVYLGVALMMALSPAFWFYVRAAATKT